MSQPPIFVTFALPEESRDFRKAIGDGTHEDIRVEHFGVGPAMAAERVNRLLAGQKPRLLICAGFAGGLAPQLRIGDLVVAENLSTPEVLAQVRAVAPTTTPCVFGSIISRTLPVEFIADKAALHRETGAFAVDMESEAVAAACRAAGVPLLVVRTISDPADAALPVPFADWFDIGSQRPRVAGLLKYLATRPGKILPFARFVRGLAPARQALTRFLLELNLATAA
jgi:adenosylhomocysteine nucleosidase